MGFFGYCRHGVELCEPLGCGRCMYEPERADWVMPGWIYDDLKPMPRGLGKERIETDAGASEGKKE